MIQVVSPTIVGMIKKCPSRSLPMHHNTDEGSKESSKTSSPSKQNNHLLFLLCLTALLASLAFNLSWYTSTKFSHMTSTSQWKKNSIHDAPVVVKILRPLRAAQRCEEKLGKMDSSDKYPPGYNVEIIEHDPTITGKVALWPGVISTVNTDGTYNIIKVERVEQVSNLTTKQFQLYEPYTQGTWAAYFDDESGKHVPVTIVEYKSPPSSSGDGGNNLAKGTYKFTYDTDKKNEVHEGLAIKLHRFILP